MSVSYRFGFDVGIGSIGWAVIRVERGNMKGDSCLENFGVRIFDSGEVKGSKRKSQIRRGDRGTRRLTRRCSHRKDRIKAYFEKCKFLTLQEMREANETLKVSPLKLKTEGLDRKLSLLELYLCLIHTCNNRGYRDFYEDDESVIHDEISEVENIENEEETEEEKEEGKNKQAAKELNRLFQESGYRTISEYFWEQIKPGAAQEEKGIRNKSWKENRLLVKRKMMLDELRQLLEYQKQFYRDLDPGLIEEIIFSQRCFEDGPGDPGDITRKYTGFIESLGSCPFYKTEKRGFRATVLGDLYAVVNNLSQRRYIDIETGELRMPRELAESLIHRLLQKGSLDERDIKSLAKECGITVVTPDNHKKDSLSKSIKVIRIFKRVFEEFELPWEQYTLNDFLQKTTDLQDIEEILCKYKTPRIRKGHLKKVEILKENKAFLNRFASLKLKGTSGVSYRYMVDAIQAFLNGEVYGNFQDRWQREQTEGEEGKNTYKYIPAKLLVQERDISNNPVVMRAVNELRKLINALVRIYGSPYSVSIEVASELSQSFKERRNVETEQRENEKKRDKRKKEIAKLLGINFEDVTERMVEIHRLYFDQEGKSPYSRKDLGNITEILTDKNNKFEIDHIVPFSLVLDNTWHNKALVFAEENKEKGQRTPLMYLREKGGDEDFISYINALSKSNKSPISEKKYKYLMMETIYGKEADEILSGWKSRNINDTRYASRFIVSFLKQYLTFEDKARVWAVKGALTSKFRRYWLNHKTWGSESKDRETNLNHAADAIVIGCLEPLYIAIADEAFKIRRMARRDRNKGYDSKEVQEHISTVVDEMKKHYGADSTYVNYLLKNVERIPCLIKNLATEVEIRFIDDDLELYLSKNKNFYGDRLNQFKIPLHMPLTSRKIEREYSGKISDSNPIRVIESVDGKKYRVVKKNIQSIKKEDVEKVRTSDSELLDQLREIFVGKADKYTIGDYLKEIGETVFKTKNGHSVNKLSICEKSSISNFYRKEYGNQYSVLGGISYYCVEVYKKKDGKLNTWGIPLTGVKKVDKKLRLTVDLPEDYGEHVMYLFTGDYLKIMDGKGKIKFEGFYQSIEAINRNRFNGYCKNKFESDEFTITSKDKVKKYSVDLLGNIGGEVKCSVPLLSSKENT